MKALAIVLGLTIALAGTARAEAHGYALESGQLVEFDPDTGERLREIPVEWSGRAALAVDASYAYLPTRLFSIQRIALATGEVDREYSLPCCLVGIELAGSTVYGLTEEFFVLTITGFDTASGNVISETTLGEEALAVAFAGDGDDPPQGSSDDSGCQVTRGNVSYLPAWLLAGALLIAALRRVSVVAALLLLTAVPALATYVPLFAPDATLSIDDGAPQPLVISHVYAQPAGSYFDPSRSTQLPPEYECADFVPPPFSSVEPVDPEDNGAALFGLIPSFGGENHGVIEGGGAEGTQVCAPESIPFVTLWLREYTWDIGIEVTRTWQNFHGGNGLVITRPEMLRHLRETMTSVASVFWRDVNLHLRIRHVRVLENRDHASNQEAFAWWRDNGLPSVNAILRLRAAPGSGGVGSFSLCGEAGGHAGWDLRGDPVHHDDRWVGNVYIIGHELTHMVGGTHTDAYDPIIERCPAQCYTGEVVCPTYEAQSWAGYCHLYCDNPGAKRLGYPIASPMTHAVRRHILDRSQCLESGEVYYGERFVDADGDEFPDGYDNCPTVANIGQEDTNLDGVGNACSGCQIARPRSGQASALLLLPAALLFAVRRG